MPFVQGLSPSPCLSLDDNPFMSIAFYSETESHYVALTGMELGK